MAPIAAQFGPVDIPSVWRRIHRILDDRFAAVAKSFNPPATTHEIEALEQRLGFCLPSDFRESLLIHNGQTDPYRMLGLTLDGTLMDIKAIDETWQMITDLDERLRIEVKDWDSIEWWNRKWIPITDNQSGDCLCINMDAGLLPVGHLVYYVHDNPFHAAQWPGFGEWLDALAIKLEAGQIQVDGEWMRVMDDEELG